MEGCLTAEVSASAIRENLRLLRERLAPGTKLCAAVKADCYGHGLGVLWHTLSTEVDGLAVAAPQEALNLRQMGYNGPVLVLFSAEAAGAGQEQGKTLEELVAREVSLTAVSTREASLVALAAGHRDIVADIHVKVDSGMGRSGISPEGLPSLVESIQRTPHLRLAGIYTHFAVAEEADKSYTLEQLDRYKRAVAACGPLRGVLLHTANSAAAIDLPQTHLGMVRPGLAVYGYQPSDRMHVKLPLRPALRLAGRLVQVRDVPKGTRCGYGLRYTFPRDGRIGLVPIGYGDGYFRCLSGKAAVCVNGHSAPIRGTISMDQIIVDLTDMPAVGLGDEVEIISPEPAAANSVENLARLAGTIPYEVTCRLGPRIRRRLVEDFVGARD
jgi:alanine racemase